MAALIDPTLEQVATLYDAAMRTEEYPLDLYEARRAEFERRVHEMFADVICEDASRDTMETELLDAGYGSAGPL